VAPSGKYKGEAKAANRLLVGGKSKGNPAEPSGPQARSEFLAMRLSSDASQLLIESHPTLWSN
jgi:hypothetical protein